MTAFVLFLSLLYLPSQLQAKSAQKFRNVLQEHLMSVALKIKVTERISTRSWNRIRKMLFEKFDAHEQVWRSMILMNGVDPLSLPNASKLAKEVDEIVKEYRFAYNPTDRTVRLDFKSVLLTALQITIKERELAGFATNLAEPIVVCFKVDGAGIGKCLTVGFMIVTQPLSFP